MHVTEISSNQNDRIKHIVKLRNRRARDEERVMTVEGYREVFRALESKCVFKEFYFCKDFFLGSNEMALLEKIAASGCAMFETAKHVFEKISYRERPEGLLGVLPFLDTSLETFQIKNKNPLFLVVEGIEKPGNLGTILRTADAAGVEAVFVANKITDIFNPNVVRSSTGTIFSMRIIEATSEEVLDYLVKNNIMTIAADPYGNTIYHQLNYNLPCAIVLGSEQYGLSQIWKENAHCVNIPMKGLADSLNVAQAGTILLFEALRQRN